MTSSDFRFKQRVWFLKKAPGVCHGCSKGCNITIDHNREKYKDDVIYRFRPLLNEQVNGYFMCDEGRLSYRAENEGRLTAPRLSKQVRSLDDILTASSKEIEGAEKISIVISPSCSLEQMVTVKALAEKLGATLSGYSDGYIKNGDGDDYLIQDDKSSNRAGLVLLAIDCSKEGFENAVEEAGLVINFNNDLSLSYAEKDLQKLLKDTKLIAVATHDNQCTAMANLAIPVASYSEYAGSVINCDNILQHFAKAITKNEDLPDISEICVRLGSPLQSDEQRFLELQQFISALKEFPPDKIPAEGLNLINDSEAANVTA
jgi:NADH-quinone oxidoreductase subunit G